MAVKRFLSVVLLLSTLLLAVAGVSGDAGRSPAAASYLLGPELRISTPSTPIDAHRQMPAVAYNWQRRQYLVVWQNQWPGSRDIYAQRVSDSGHLVGSWFAITAGTGDRIQPAVAYNATNDEYLIVWMKEVSSDVFEIWGRVIAWDNSYQKEEKKLISYPNRSFYGPRVAWNSYRNQYLVVWNAFDTTTNFPPGVPVDIAGARVSGDWNTIYTSNILTSYAGPHHVDLTYNVAMDEYFMAFVVIHTQATTGNDIYGLRVYGSTGTPVTPPGLIPIYELEENQDRPAVATNSQDRYMVVWQHEFSLTDHDIYGREYNADGTPAGNHFTIASWTQDDTVPDLAANGASREWLVVWQRALPSGAGYSVHGYRWGSGPNLVYSFLFDVINWSFYECTNPAVAADIPGYLIVYEELVPPGEQVASPATTYQHIYGRLWWPHAVFLPLVIRNAP
jgi:hypothetical protein